MTGKEEKNKTGKCPMCGGEINDGITAAPFFLGERIIVIKDVPAEVCGDCGEAFMKSSVVGNVEALLDRLEALHSEVSIVHYEAA